MGNNTIVKNKKKWDCFNCLRTNDKSCFVSKSVMRTRVYVCPACWMNNSDCIFKKRIEAKKQNLIFWSK